MINTSMKSARIGRTSAAFRATALVFICLAFLLPPAAAVADDDPPEEREFTVTRHDDFVRAKSDLINLYVSTRIVDMKPDEKPTGYIPLIFGVWNRKDKAFYIDRDRIRLLDRYGNEIPMASLEELRKEYPHMRRDQGHLDFTTFGGRFVRGSRVVPTNFFPPPGTALITTAQVHRHRRIIDLVYFKGTIEPGETYRLVFTLRKSGEELVIPFTSRGEVSGSHEMHGTVGGSVSLGG
jgi:hypothetical protein